MTPLAILREKFGFNSFRLEQERIIENVLSKKDTFVLMPTGGGKSLCYQIPAVLSPGLTVVISPLIALMKDQVDSLRLNGIDAAFINSTQSAQEQESILDRARAGHLKLLYLAPEKLLSSSSALIRYLSSLTVNLVAIDEAHCISHWGHDFRPEYLMLARLKEMLPNVPTIALAATADKLTRQDIIEKLALKDPAIFIASFNRSNITYSVEPKKDVLGRLVNFIKAKKGEAGIIYCLSRNSTEQFAEDLRQHGIKALAYHAGMDSKTRAAHQDKFLKDEVQIIVATIAFGMGVNKSNVRFVVHVDLPKNIEGYYQETGRAGRDGLPSEALLFFSESDVHKLKHFAKVEGNQHQTLIALDKLQQMATYAEVNSCRRKYLLNYFDEKADSYCGNCDVCLTRVEQYDGTENALKILSAISQVGECYGAGYVIDILKGSTSIKIQEKHKSLPAYRSGAELSREEWMKVIVDLIDQGLVTKTKGMYPLLVLTEKGSQAANIETRIMLTKSKVREAQETEVPYESQLLANLKEARRVLAIKDNVPPFVVVSDASLVEVATYLPKNKEQLRKISGFGEVKVQRYGKDLLAAVEDYCKQNQLESRTHMKLDKQERRHVEKDTPTKRQTLDLYRKGLSIEKIAAMRQLTVSTIETHLAFYIQKGLLDLADVLTLEQIASIRRAINAADNRLYSTIKMKLGDEFTYGQIKLVMADLERDREIALL